MKIFSPICCEGMKNGVELETIRYSKKFREWGIPIQEDRGTSVLLIVFCPWCRKHLPISLRDEWFKKLEQIGFNDPLGDSSIPSEFKSDKWWNKSLEKETPSKRTRRKK